MTVTEGSERLDFAGIAPDIDIASWARTLSDDSRFNLAAYLKYSFGVLCSGMTDEDWILEADTVLEVINSR